MMMSKCHDHTKRNTGDQTKRKQSLNILSWNVNDIRDQHEGQKTEIPDFSKTLNDHDIFCLQETKGEVNILNFIRFNSNRADSRSGGVCIGVRKSLSSGIQKVKVLQSEDFVVVKLKARSFNLLRDTNIVNVYNSPLHSSFKKRKNKDGGVTWSTIDLLADCISNIPDDKDIILVGDFNARSGLLDDSSISGDRHVLLQMNTINNTTRNQPDFPKRCNQDQKINADGKPFIDLTKTLGLTILNGRILGDVFGNYTCLKYNGCSTVYYMCVSSSLYYDVSYFKVCEHSRHSHHKPLSCSIRLQTNNKLFKKTPHHRFFDAPRAFKWNQSPNIDGSSFKFRLAQDDSSIKKRITALMERKITSITEILTFNEATVNLMTDIASEITQVRSNKRTNKKKWFD